MKLFKAVEFEGVSPTGMVETYLADSIEEAVQKVLYTRQLANADASVGPSGRVVRSGKLAWSVVPDKPVT
jgi:hypothetical protein